MLGSSTEIWAVWPLTWRAIDLGIDQISYVCKALATIAISLHHESYRTLALLSPLAGQIPGCALRSSSFRATAQERASAKAPIRVLLSPPIKSRVCSGHMG